MWLPNRCKTVFSLLNSTIKPEALAKKIKELGYSHCCISDDGNIIGSIRFAEKMQKQEITPVLGNEFSCFIDEKINKLTILARNKAGWDTLIKLTSLSNQQFNKIPIIKLEQIAAVDNGNLLVLAGYTGSYTTEQDIVNLKKLFGDNLYLCIERFLNPTEYMREIAKKHNIRAIASADVRYLEKKDAEYHRIAICSNMKTTLPDVKRMLQNNQTFAMSPFFTNDCFNLPTTQDLRNLGHTESEIDCSDLLAKIEKYSIFRQPQAPKFKTNTTEIEFLKELCRAGWKKRVQSTWDIEVYKNRVLRELETIEEFNLAGYLLVVWDYIQFAKKRNVLVGAGRGSSSGSLVSYLVGITEVDPIPYGLIFERFINVSRFYSSHVNFKEFDYLENYKNTPLTQRVDLKLHDDRKDLIKNNQYCEEEWNIVFGKMKNGPRYYDHIINNVDIDRSNPNNSYIMWCAGKVDNIDVTKPCKIVEERYSLPDVDTDFPPFFRERVIEYITEKYGENNVAQILTLGALKGKSALKEVIRVTQSCDFETATQITNCLPEEAKIADEMEEQKEDSIILFVLKNTPDILKQYVTLENDELKGDYAETFRAAIEIEGCYKSFGKHAAGIVVAPESVDSYCPFIKVGDSLVAAFDKKDLEKVGLIKFDILGVSSLEKLQAINELLRYGKFVDDRIAHYV